MMKVETRAVTLLLEWRTGGWMKMVNRIMLYVSFCSVVLRLRSKKAGGF